MRMPLPQISKMPTFKNSSYHCLHEDSYLDTGPRQLGLWKPVELFLKLPEEFSARSKCQTPIVKTK